MDYSAFCALLDPLRLPAPSKAAFERLVCYAAMLCEKNKVMNLTAIRDEEEVFVRHFADSLAVYAAHSQIPARMIDVGCGAGFPGLPLKIYFDDRCGDGHTALTLLDATRKKIDFLADVCAALSLTYVTPLSARAEDVAASPSHREQYDLVVSRAVADLRVLSELCLPFARVGGLFAPHKSDRSDEEIAAAENGCRKLGGRLTGQFVYAASPDAPKSRILLIAKESHTPQAYPRAYAKIKSHPL